MKPYHRAVERRPDNFVQKTVTKIWQEHPSDENPYLAKGFNCHGYPVEELLTHGSYSETLFLLFRGELPTAPQQQLLDKLMIALINPGPRHPATRAAMTASVGKADLSHVLPVSLSVLGGKRHGAAEVESCLRFLRRHRKSTAQQVLDTQLKKNGTPQAVAPGFGSRYGSCDPWPNQVARQLLELPAAGKNLEWGQQFAEALQPHHGGWLMTGVAAATLGDLGFHPRATVGLYQLFSAPGLLAHGLELANKPINAMPFPSDEDYIIEHDDN